MESFNKLLIIFILFFQLLGCDNPSETAPEGPSPVHNPPSNPALEWSESSILLASDREDDEYFGTSVSISGDFAIVGASFDDDNGLFSGSAYIFAKDSSGNWIQEQELKDVDGAQEDWFGCSVSISGNRAAVGAYGDSFGSVFIFLRSSSGTWSLEQKITVSGIVSSIDFGSKVSISGDLLIVGAKDDKISTEVFGPGSAYVYHRNVAGTWVLEQKLMASDNNSLDYFGCSVAVSGNTAVIGAYGDDDNGSFSGSVYLFDRDSLGTWSQTQKIIAIDGEASEYFGKSVAISGDRAAVGAYKDDDNGMNSGSVYILSKNSMGVWSQTQKLLAEDGSQDDEMGFSVSLSGDTLISGASKNNNGSAYIFKDDSSGNWVFDKKLTASDGSASDKFGYSVSISDNQTIIGALNHDDENEDEDENSGAAYIFIEQ